MRFNLSLVSAVLALSACTHTPSTRVDSPPTLWTLAGEPIPLVDVLQGGPAVLAFMTVWCETCRAEQPLLERWATDQGKRPTITVISGSKAPRAQQVATRRQLVLDVYADPTGELADVFGVTETPSYVLLDPTGKLLGVYADLSEIPAPPEPTPSLRLITDKGEELGTSYEIAIWSLLPPERVRNDLAAAREECHRLEGVLSEWRPDSDLTRLNQAPAGEFVTVDPALLRLVEASLKVCEATEGAFDITWFSLAQLWNDAAQADRLPSAAEVDAARSHVGADKIAIEDKRIARLDAHTRIGLGGVAKGWIVDTLFHLLRARGHENLIVNIGGDLRAAGVDGSGQAHTIRLHNPFDPAQVVHELELGDTAVATSGHAFRSRHVAGKSYGHILDPRSGWPVEFEGSVTVITKDTAMADALATALLVLGPEKGLALAKRTPGLDVVYVTPADQPGEVTLRGSR